MQTAGRRGSAATAARLFEAAEWMLTAALLAISSPVFLGVALTILILSRRTPFVAHLRSGQAGQPFWMWKFRTMWPRHRPAAAPGLVERVHSVPFHWRKANPDPRVTSRFARFCRKYSLDELPQLCHVLSGRMALLGPRPLTAEELAVHYGTDTAEVLSVKPGITGLWQVNGRNRLTYPQRLRLDLFFVRHNAPGLRCIILLRSLAVVLSGRNAS